MRRLALVAAVSAATVLSGVGAQAAHRPVSHATAAHAWRMSSLLAYNPVWVDRTGQLAFLGNRRDGDPVNIYLWNPVANKLAAATTDPRTRHSLTAAADGRLAYVEREDVLLPSPEASNLTDDVASSQPQPGPETIVVQDLHGGTSSQPFKQGWVLPGSLVWSPDNARLAFVTLDRKGSQRLALLDLASGTLSLIKLGADYEIPGVVGWTTPHDVLLRVKTSDQPEHLLQVGRDGLHQLPPADDPKLSPDGHYLLVRVGSGFAIRTLTGASHMLLTSAGAYAWDPKGNRIFAGRDREVVALDLRGHVLRRWPSLAQMAVGQLSCSLDDRFLAFSADFGLGALSLR